MGTYCKSAWHDEYGPRRDEFSVSHRYTPFAITGARLQKPEGDPWKKLQFVFSVTHLLSAPSFSTDEMVYVADPKKFIEVEPVKNPSIPDRIYEEIERKKKQRSRKQ